MEFLEGYLFGNTKFSDLLLLVMAIDIITGILKAVKKGCLFTKTAWIGYAKKIGVFCLIILANVIDQILNLNGWLAFTTVLFYIATEGLSILENLAEFGVNVPAAIRDKLKVIQEKSKEDKGA